MGDRSGITRLALGFATLAIVVTACGGRDETRDTSSPQATVAASPARSAAPSAAAPTESAAATETPGSTAGTDEPTVILEPDTLAEVMITELVVRSLPRVSDDSVIYDPVLGEGQRLFVVDGPEEASGYWWYLVQPLTRNPGDPLMPFGWVSSADRNGEAWLRAVEPECPEEVESVEDIGALRPEEALVCFGDGDLTFTAEHNGCGSTDDAQVDPEWFQGYSCTFAPESDSSVMVRFPPDVDPEPVSDAGTYTVTGHFNHPEARDCTWADPPTEDAPTAQAVMTCRTQFVVASMEPAS